MIDEEYYVFPKEEPKQTKSPTEVEASRKLEDELNALDFRPFTDEW